MHVIKNILLGIVAGVIATLTVHELIKCVFYDANIIPYAPWDMSPKENGLIPGAPHLVNGALWGALWGGVFGLFLGGPPKGSMTLRGALLGILGPAVAGVFLLAPLTRGGAPFLGGDVGGIIAILCIFAGFGAATAWLYGLFQAGGRLPR